MIIVNVEMDNNQAYDFAKAIFADIDAYIQTHQAEFDAFMREELSVGGIEESEVYANAA